MKVLFATPEFAPLVKTGGLADVAGSLPSALGELGADVRVLLPGYPSVLGALGLDQPAAAARALVAELPAVAQLPAARLLGARSASGIALLVLQAPTLFERPGNPYLGPDGRDWPDNALRFGLLSRAAAVLGSPASPLGWHPDIVHAHDWQAALAPVYLAYMTGRRAATVVTIHNLAYQGNFEPGWIGRIGLAPESFTIDGAEFYGQLSFLKGGIALADAITTVSPTYAREICTAALGFGMEGLLSARRARLTGILNGVDTDFWNPASDRFLAARFDADHLDARAINKQALQVGVGLDLDAAAPVFGVVSRLVEQKGIDLIADVIPGLVGQGAQFVFQGLGDPALEARLRVLAQDHPGRVAVRIAFDEALVHLIEGGADAFLMPSRFEPCGMNQMYSQRYGCLPIVSRTGGLADSVTDASPERLADGTASGFVFAPGDAAALEAAIGRALALYRDRGAWRAMQRAAMERDVSWGGSAAQYLHVYRRLRPPNPA